MNSKLTGDLTATLQVRIAENFYLLFLMFSHIKWTTLFKVLYIMFCFVLVDLGRSLIINHIMLQTSFVFIHVRPSTSHILPQECKAASAFYHSPTTKSSVPHSFNVPKHQTGNPILSTNNDCSTRYPTS